MKNHQIMPVQAFSLRSIQKLHVTLPPSLTKSRRKMLSLRSNALIVGLPGAEPPAEPAEKSLYWHYLVVFHWLG